MSEIPPPPPPPPVDYSPPGASPPPPIDYEPLQPPARPRWPGVVAWVVILGVTGYLFVGNLAPELRGRKRPPGAAGPTPVTMAAPTAGDMQFTLSAKYAVGMRQLVPAAGEKLIKAIDDIAKTPRHKLFAAVVAGELLGADEALKRLDPVSAPPSSAPSEPSSQPSDQQIPEDLEALRTIYTAGPDALDRQTRQGLIDRHGYFGKLALSFKRDSSDALRREVMDSSRRTAMTAVGGVALAALLGLSGLVLLITGVVMYASGQLRPAYTPQPWAGTVYVEMFAVYLVCYVVGSVAISLLSGGQPPLAAAWTLIAVLPIAILYGLARGESWDQMRTALGWHGGRGAVREFFTGIIGYLAGLPVVMIGFAVTLLLVRLTGATPSHPIQAEATDTPLKVLTLFSIASVMAPLLEETMFRGALFHHMRRRWRWLISASVVALIFAAIHPQGWATIPALGSIALVLAGIREWRGSIIAPVAAHAFSNGAVLTLFLLAK